MRGEIYNDYKNRGKYYFFRKKKELTQDELANILEVSNQAVSKWEADKCCLT